jgi:hypothetical protein
MNQIINSHPSHYRIQALYEVIKVNQQELSDQDVDELLDIVDDMLVDAEQFNDLC